MKLRILLYLAFAAAARTQCPGGYTAQRSITVNSAQVAGTLSNFPRLVLNPTTGQGDPNNLKTVGNGGRVTSANGYDIIFVNSGGTPLAFELVGHGTASTTYDAATGNAQFRVKVASEATGAAVYICYGNAAVTTYQGDDAATWTGYSGVWSFGTSSSLALTDSSGTGITLTNHSAAASAGKVGGAAASTSSNYLSGDSTALSFGSGAFSIGGWFKTSSMTNSIILDMVTTGPTQLMYLGIYDIGSGNKEAMVGNGATNIGGTTGLNDNAWHQIVTTNDGANNTKLYVDGGQVNSGSIVWTIIGGGANGLTIGRDAAAGATFTGDSDEITMIGTLRSADWVAAQYNNENNPGAYYAVGAETNPSAGTFTISPIALPLSNAADIVVSLTGSGTAWDGTTVITATGVSGTSCGSLNVTTTTAATIICTTGATAGTLTLTESVTGTAVATVPVTSGGGTHAFVGSGG